MTRWQLSAHELVLAAALLLGVLVVEAHLRSAPDPRAGGAAAIGTPSPIAPGVEALRRTPFQLVRDPVRAAVVSGIVFGRTDQIPKADKLGFQRSGLWHLLAASGQNVVLVAGICVACAWFVGAGRALGVVWALVAVPAYVVVVGGGASIDRAGIMLELALVAWLVGRLRHTRQLVVASAALLVWIFPGVHRTLGFQLSFACVLALLAFATPCARRLHEWGLPGPLAEGVGATLICSLATAPLLLATTGSAPMLASVANLVAVPAASVVLVAGLTGSLLAPVAPLVASPLLGACGQLAGLLLWLSRASLRLPFAAVQQWSQLALLLGGAACAWWLWRLARQARWLRAAACLALFAAVVAAVIAVRDARRLPPPPPGIVRVTFLNVGQGDAQLVQSHGHAVLVDTGPPRAGIVDLLRARSVNALDGIVVTHDQLDHDGALADLVGAMRVGWVAVPARAPGDWKARAGRALPIVPVCAGATLTLGDARLRVEHPRCDGPLWSATGDPRNDNAVVLVVYAGSRSIALTADAESPVTLRVGLGSVDVLKVAHHGSADDRLSALLAQTRPRLAVVSVGHNSYGHPAPSTLQALVDARVPTLRTDRDGSVVVESDGTAIWRAQGRALTARAPV